MVELTFNFVAEVVSQVRIDPGARGLGLVEARGELGEFRVAAVQPLLPLVSLKKRFMGLLQP